MATYRLKFMFDWGSGVCLWSENSAAQRRFGYAVLTSDLPVPLSMQAELEALIDQHDCAMNRDDPAGDLLWSDAQVEDFLQSAQQAYYRLCDALGPDYEVSFRCRM